MFFAAIVVLTPSARRRAVTLRLENLAEVDFRDAQVTVTVALDVLQSGEILFRDVEHHPFGDHGHAVAATLRSGA